MEPLQAIEALRIWPWTLMAVQVLAICAAARGRRWGWLLGGWIQIPWILYAIVTSQFGFIPGCVVSAAIQMYSFFKPSVARTGKENRWNSA